jgi:flagellar basal-body rod modification protein FlgD
MAVSTVGNSVTLAEAAQKATTKKTDTLGTETFLKLMITEMQNQDPTNPMDSSEMVNQMAQLNSVTSMQKMTQALTSMQLMNQILSATTMMGKTVTYADSSGNKVSGKVDSVAIDGSDVTLTVGDQSVSLSSVEKVS